MRPVFWGTCALVLAIGLVAGPATAVAKKKPKLSVQAANVAEGNSGITSMTFAVKLSKKSRKDVSAEYTTADGSATAPSDYAAEHGTVKIKKRKTTGEITVAVAGDTTVEPDETFLVVLSNPKRAKLATPSAQGTIVNDDSDSGGGGGGGGNPPTGADIQLTGLRETPATVRGDSPVNEQLTVTNNGPEAADGVAISITMPAGGTLNATWSSPACGAAAPGIVCQLGSMASGTSQTVTAAIQIPLATSSQNYSIPATAAASSPADPVAGNASFVDSFTVPAGNATIAQSSVTMPRNGSTERLQEVAAGDAIADSYRETYGTDFGFAQGGGIRNGVTCNVSNAVTFCPNTSGPPFAITRGAISATLPFFNRIDTFSISGTELWAMLEKSVSVEPGAFAGFLQVSGLCFTWKQSGTPNVNRVQSVFRQNANGSCSATPIPADGTQYTVAQSNFDTAGANGHQNFSSRATHHGYDADVFTEWAIAHSPLNPASGRITAIP